MRFCIGEDELKVENIKSLTGSPASNIEFSKSAQSRVAEYRSRVQRQIGTGKTIYGINTGFGLLSDVRIQSNQIDQLQANLIRSHAIGVGPLLDDHSVRALILVKAQGIAFGPSGVRPELIQMMLSMLQNDVLPCIPCKGSVGASGDLAPLAHLALAMIGEGNVRYKGVEMPALQALALAGLNPVQLQAKEGLSLINGTQFMTAIGALACSRAIAVAKAADIAAALSLDAFRGTLSAFDPRIHQIRRQNGQVLVAKNIRSIFSQPDEIMNSHADCGKVQDPYSFRCVPQVHGASRDAINYVREVLDRELNAVTDNPLVFEDDSVISGGNFHGQPVAIAMDFLAIAMAELASISERRIEKLTNPVMSGLPAFLIKDSGLNSGFMISHVTAAALVSENKVLAHPASVDSIPTSADKEDHVSMGPIAARKAMEVCENAATVLAIEFAAAAQGIDLLSPHKPNIYLQAIHKAVRSMMPYLHEDAYVAPQLDKLTKWVLDGGPSKVLTDAGLDLE
jgi:histidine ammonia-lyase